MGLAVGAIAGGMETRREYGRAGATDRTLGPGTLFPLGGLARVPVGFLLADAVVRGETALDAQLATFLPGTARHPRGRPITLEDLATHRAGLARRRPGRGPTPSGDADPLAVLRTRPRRPPGGGVRPSDLGIDALAAALTAATGTTFTELLARRLGTPLGLADTVAAVDDERRARLAVGHDRRGRVLADAAAGLPVTGGWHTTVNDLVRILRAHLDPVTSGVQEPLELAMTPRAAAGRRTEVSLAWHVLTRRDGQRWWWQNTQGRGATGFLAFAPDTGSGVAVLANSPRPVELLGMTLMAHLTS